MHDIFFISVLLILLWLDIRHFWVPNWIVLPAIVIGCFVTGNIIWAIVGLLIGIACYNWIGLSGGDAKLFMLVGSFLGGHIFHISAIAILSSSLYAERCREPRFAFAPFIAIPSAIVALMI